MQYGNRALFLVFPERKTTANELGKSKLSNNLDTCWTEEEMECIDTLVVCSVDKGAESIICMLGKRHNSLA